MAIDKKVEPAISTASDSAATSSSAAATMGNPSTDYQSTYPTHRPQDTTDVLPPPAYASTQAQGPWHPSRTYDDQRRKRSFRRAVHWTLAAVLVLFFWKLMFGGGRSTEPGGPYPPESDGSPTHWPDWSSPREKPRSEWPSSNRGPFYSTTTNFTLDPSAATLFLHARGPGYGGHLEYVFRDSSSGKVEVGIEAVYSGISERDRITIAKMENSAKGTQGVGIYSDGKRWGWSRDQVYIYITFALPHRQYNTLETDVENIGTLVSSLGSSSLAFKRFDLRSGNGAVTIKPDLIASDVIFLRNENGHIDVKGQLVTALVDAKCNNGRLVLSNVVSPAAEAASGNGRVEGTFHISHRLSLHSDNGAVDAKIYVEKAKQSAGTAADDHRVDVDATSDNGHVGLIYVAQDPDVLLFSRAHSDTGHTSVRHAKTFVGEVNVGTEVGHLEVRTPPPSSKRVWEVVDERKGMLKHRIHAKLYNQDSPDVLGSTTAFSEVGSVDVSFD